MEDWGLSNVPLHWDLPSLVLMKFEFVPKSNWVTRWCDTDFPLEPTFSHSYSLLVLTSCEVVTWRLLSVVVAIRSHSFMWIPTTTLVYLCLLYINAISKCPSWISPAMGKYYLVLHQHKHIFGLYRSSLFIRNSVAAHFSLWWARKKKKTMNLIVWKLAELCDFN